MIIDAHAHLNAPPELYAYQAALLCSGGAHGRSGAGVSDAQIREYGEKTVRSMDGVGTDLQLISPRPYHTAHSARPARVVQWWTSAVNEVIARQVAMFPTRLAGVAAIPQSPDLLPAEWADELRKTVSDLNMVGCVLNPDPAEGSGFVPPLGDPYWFPVYEALIELDIPALVHSGACRNGRESYSEHFVTEESIAILSLLNSEVFLRYPSLKIMIAHGGGSVPYQIGRWRAARAHPKLRGGHLLDEPFDESLRRLWFDTVLHSPLSLELLVRTVGAGRCVFGTERPGSATAADPANGRDYDDIKPVIDRFDFLTDDERAGIFAGNARSLFTLSTIDPDIHLV